MPEFGVTVLNVAGRGFRDKAFGMTFWSRVLYIKEEELLVKQFCT